MSRCQITGIAELQETLGIGTVFTRCDPEIHVADELLSDLSWSARSMFEDVYRIEEPCPHEPHTRHARLIPGRAPANAQIGNPT